MNIVIKSLHKTYKNGTKALQDIHLTMGKGIFGLLGPNGAGKTTLMRILATIMDFDAGEIHFDTLDIKENIYQIRKIIGYLPQEFGLYPNLTLIEFLDYICLLHEINDARERKKRIEQAIEVTNLTGAAMKKLKTFSGGMKRRAGIAQCLLNNPEIIIVDEPTAGLDPEERIRYKNLLSVLGEQSVIIFSTHIIADIEDICTKIGIIQEGKILFEGTSPELINTTHNQVWIGTCPLEELAQKEAEFIVVNKKLECANWEYRMIGDTAPFPDSQRDKMTIEDAYISMMRGFKP